MVAALAGLAAAGLPRNSAVVTEIPAVTSLERDFMQASFPFSPSNVIPLYECFMMTSQ